MLTPAPSHKMQSPSTTACPVATRPHHGKGVEATAHFSNGMNTNFFFFFFLPFLNFTEGIAISKPNLFAEEDAMN